MYFTKHIFHKETPFECSNSLQRNIIGMCSRFDVNLRFIANVYSKLDKFLLATGSPKIDLNHLWKRIKRNSAKQREIEREQEIEAKKKLAKHMAQPLPAKRTPIDPRETHIHGSFSPFKWSISFDTCSCNLFIKFFAVFFSIMF